LYSSVTIQKNFIFFLYLEVIWFLCCQVLSTAGQKLKNRGIVLPSSITTIGQCLHTTMSTADEIVIVSVKPTGTPKRRAVCYETPEEWLRQTRRKLTKEKKLALKKKKLEERMKRWMKGRPEEELATARRTMERCIRCGKNRDIIVAAIDRMFTTFLLRYDSSDDTTDAVAKFAALFDITERFNAILEMIHSTTDKIGDEY